MAFTSELISTLKQELRASNITYARIAQALGLSESSIKRLFSEGDMSLSRFDAICGLLGMDISQLAQKATEQRRHVLQLTEAQEKTLVGEDKLLLVATHLLYGWNFEQVLAAYEIDRFEGQHYLTTLDRLGIIELLPENRFRMTLSPEFQWRKDGPIQQFFERELQSEYFNSSFTRDGELRLVVNGWLSRHSLNAFHENIFRLKKEFEIAKDNDRHVPVEDRKGTTLVIAIRPWTLEIFARYARPV